MIAFELHLHQVFILPLLAIEHGTCENPDCPANHFRLTLGWLVGSVQIQFP